MIRVLSRALLAALVLVAGAAAVALAASAGDDAPPAAGSATDRWGALTPGPLERTEVGGDRIGRHIYVVGGFVAKQVGTGKLVRYDIKRDRWQKRAPLPIDIHHPAVTSYKGKLYVSGGRRTSGAFQGPTNRLYRYNPKRDRWRRMADHRVPRIAHAIGVIGKRIYIAGGNNDDGDLRSVEVYNPRKNSWRPGKAMPTARHHVGFAVLDRKLYVVAGRADGENIAVVERLDPRAGRQGRWRELAPVDIPRSGFSVVAARGTIIAAGGEELGPGGETIPEVEQFDPETGEWGRLPSMTTPRHGMALAVRSGRLYALEGGPEPGLSLSAAAEFLDLP